VSGFAAKSNYRDRPGFLEDLYIRTRMQRFGGRNVTTTGLYGRTAIPLFADAVVDAALRLPVHRKRDGDVIRDAIIAWVPELAIDPLGSGEMVAPRSLRRPSSYAAWAGGFGRKALARWAPARLQPASPAVADPWQGVVRSRTFRTFVDDVLLSSDSRLSDYIERDHLRGLATGALEARRDFYAFGLALTAELVLRRGTA
jgi:hypothetical protein